MVERGKRSHTRSTAFMEFIRNTMKRRLLLFAAFVLFGASVVPASAGAEASFRAVKVKDKVYVEAEALEQVAGGKGTYDNKSNTYRFKSNDIPAIVEKVSPSVVSIIGRQVDAEDNSDNWLSHGTGVVIRKDGWIVTNAHVILALKKPVVVTPEGKSYAVSKWFADEESDIALIKIAAQNMKPAVFVRPNSTLKVGEAVVALGTPVSFMLRNSATSGIISGIDRAVDSSYKLIQTDAAINPGNSGGPLVNMRGEVIGINSMKFAAVGIENMGFTIPADTVTMVVQHFFKYSKMKRASIGVELEESWAAYVGLPTDDPIRVTNVVSPQAKKAGIAEGDVLYAINGKPVKTLVDVNEVLKVYLPGQQVKLTMQAKGNLVTKVVALSEATKPAVKKESEVDKNME
ncbi:S1C family serine protease [Paenibacillus sp. S-12]|uniref:S1C family serine protease n=1 Tax=Paenibacillus sp. S-12 TaxID=3031371 RepID=UPI0025A0AF59|nr:S1C family serine protease [Paenibacillus sp. S-12]